MLLAAAVGDEDRFDAIWGWTKDNIRRPDGLLSFLWKDGKVADPEAGVRRRRGRGARPARRVLPLQARRPARRGA